MGGTSRGAELLVAVGAAAVVDEDAEDVGEEEDDCLGLCDSLLVDDVVESGVAMFSSVVLLLLLSSVSREMPKRLYISSLRRPLDSRNVILRSTGASRMESSCKNFLACSMSSERGVSSEFGDDMEAE